VNSQTDSRNSKIKKISVVGNACAGKTRLSRKLAKIYGLPITHVDSIQFLPGMTIRSYRESIDLLSAVQLQESWLIDGFGPLDIIEKRFETADLVIFIDFPIWRNYWWATKRNILNLWSRREELPEGCDERSLKHILKLYKTLWQVHTKMRPELLRIFTRDQYKNKILFIRSIKELKEVLTVPF
jgi:adenylate kinase family enzyme